MHKAREFKLVLCADVWHYLGDHTVGELRRALAAEKADGGFGYLSSEPSVTYNLRDSGSAPDEESSHIVSKSRHVPTRAPL